MMDKQAVEVLKLAADKKCFAYSINMNLKRTQIVTRRKSWKTFCLLLILLLIMSISISSQVGCESIYIHSQV